MPSKKVEILRLRSILGPVATRFASRVAFVSLRTGVEVSSTTSGARDAVEVAEGAEIDVLEEG